MTWHLLAVTVVGVMLVGSSGCSSGSDAPAPADPTSRENASAAKGAEA